VGWPTDRSISVIKKIGSKTYGSHCVHDEASSRFSQFCERALKKKEKRLFWSINEEQVIVISPTGTEDSCWLKCLRNSLYIWP
jgi:hypothetical protein